MHPETSFFPKKIHSSPGLTPHEINENNEIELVCIDKDITDSFYAVVAAPTPRLAYTDSTAVQEFAHLLASAIEGKRVSYLHYASTNELRMEGFSDIFIASAEDFTTIREEASQLALSYILWLKQHKVLVVLRNVEVIDHVSGEKSYYQRFIIGGHPIPNNEIAIDNSIVSTLLFAKKSLGIALPDDIQIYSVETYEEDCGVVGSRFKSTAQGLFQNRGLGWPGKAIIFGSATQRFDSDGGLRLQSNSLESIISSSHEVVHAIDPYFTRRGNTRGLQEGFSVSISKFKLNTDEALAVLRREFGSVEYLTFDRVIHALTAYDATARDTYYLSGTLFCYIYEKFGPKGLMSFYNRATRGELKPSRERILCSFSILHEEEHIDEGSKILNELISSMNRAITSQVAAF